MAKQQTLVRVAQSRVGAIKAGRVLAFMLQWSICREDIGHEPTIEEYIAYWGESESERTVYRHQALFREAFPGETTPDRLLDQVGAQWDRRRGARGLGATALVA